MVRMKVIGRELYAEIDDDALAWMEAESVAALPNEGGGFLFGKYSEDGMVVYVEKAEHSVKSKGSDASFERSVKIEQFVEMYNNGLIYVGEWHSHPNGKADYSGRDMQSMIEIAECKTTIIEHPLLVIIGAKSKRVREYKVYMYDNGKLQRYESC